MTIPIPENEFVKFIIMGKRSTYASPEKDTRVNPALPGSHQLEYRKGSLLYRDVYFGGDFFIGQETIYFGNDPIWGMCYAGGINEGFKPSQGSDIYLFLQAALREVSPSAPYRGPKNYEDGKYSYTNLFLGHISRFTGVETISISKKQVYQLHYSGGVIIG